MPRVTSIHPRQSLRTTLSCRPIMFPCKPFRSNTSKILCMCSFQKTYSKVKSFRMRTYKKPGGPPLPNSSFPLVYPERVRREATRLPRAKSRGHYLPPTSRWWGRWRLVGAPLRNDGKRPLSLFLANRYQTLSSQRGGVHPSPPSVSFLPRNLYPVRSRSAFCAFTSRLVFRRGPSILRRLLVARQFIFLRAIIGTAALPLSPGRAPRRSS
jgi:hypothetical protein